MNSLKQDEVEELQAAFNLFANKKSTRLHPFELVPSADRKRARDHEQG